MDYSFEKHRKNFTPVAKQAAAAASNKPSREIKSVPHIKLTKSQLEFILKMPKPMVKWFEHGWGGNGATNDEDELYQKLMDEKKKNKKLQSEVAKYKESRDKILILIYFGLMTNSNPYNIPVSHSRGLQLVVRNMFSSTQDFINTLNKFAECDPLEMYNSHMNLTNRVILRKWDEYSKEIKKKKEKIYVRNYFNSLTKVEHVYFRERGRLLYYNNPRKGIDSLIYSSRGGKY